MSKEHAAKVMQEIFSQGTYEGDLLGIHEGRKISDTPRTNVAQHNMGSIVEPHYVVDADFSRYLERELAEAITKERERCARVCEERGSFNSMYAHHILTGAAEAIRKGEKESLTVAKRKPVPEFELIEKWEGK